MGTEADRERLSTLLRHDSTNMDSDNLKKRVIYEAAEALCALGERAIVADETRRYAAPALKIAWLRDLQKQGNELDKSDIQRVKVLLDDGAEWQDDPKEKIAIIVKDEADA